MFLNKELINLNNKLYYVYRRLSKDSFKEGYLNDLKQYWDCPVVVKHVQNSDLYLFLREIPDAELVTE